MENGFQTQNRSYGKPIFWKCQSCNFSTKKLTLFLYHVWSHPSTAVLCSTCDVVTHLQIWNLYSRLTNNRLAQCPICSELICLRGSRSKVSKPWPSQLCIKCEHRSFPTGEELVTHLECQHNFSTNRAKTIWPSNIM